MAEVIVSPNAKETIITLGDGTIVSATISQETLSVVSEKADPVVVDLNSGPRGQPGSAILVGEGFPLMSQGAIGDIFLSTGGVNVGAVFKKTETAWVEEGNVRGPAGGVESVNGDFGPGVLLDKTDIGLEFVDNTSDLDKPVSTATQTALNLKANAADTVNLTGAQSINDVKTFVFAPVVPDNAFAISKVNTLQASLDAKALDSAVVHLAGIEVITGTKTFNITPVVPDASWTFAKVDGLQAALDLKAPLASPTFTGTVSGITKAMVGLGSVDNTSDAAKPISTAAQAALDLKAPIASPTFTGTVSGITKAMVGLGNVLDLAQVALTTDQTVAGIKTFSFSPIVPTPTTATQAANKGYVDTTVNAVIDAAPGALDTLNELAAALGDDPNFATTTTNQIATKEPIISAGTTAQYWRGDKTWQTHDKASVGLSNVDNTSDASKPVSTATQTALNLKVALAGTETITGAKTFSSLLTASAGISTVAISMSGTLTIAPVGNAAIELGRVDGTASTPLIDFHAGATATDYDARIIATSGNGSAGQGGLSITAGTVTFSGAVTATSFSGNGAAITALNGSNISTGTVAQARIVPNTVRVVHGSTAGTARPTGATYVEWVGSVSPTNIAADDTWINTSASGNTADNYPSGTVLHSASSKSAAPTGWYWMEGQQILISGDTPLYNELTNNGTVFPYGANTNGSGAAGSTHFRLPNGLGKHLVHVDGTTEFASIGATGGTKSFLLTTSHLPAHNHTVTDTHIHQLLDNSSTWTWNDNHPANNEDIYLNGAAAAGGLAPGNYLVTRSGPWNFTRTVAASTGGGSIVVNNSTGGGTAVPILNPYLGLRSMIKR